MNDTRIKIKYNELKKFFQLEKEICFCKFAKSYRSVMSCTLATKSADLFVFNLQPFFSQKLNRSYGSCENRRSSLLPAAGDVSQSRTSATQRQKFHTDDINLSGIRPWTLHRRNREQNLYWKNSVSRPELQSLSKENGLSSFSAGLFIVLESTGHY